MEMPTNGPASNGPTGDGPTKEQIFAQMLDTLGEIPPAIEKASSADQAVFFEQMRSSRFAMPPEGGALDAETRTLVYLAVALATSNQACVLTMIDKADMQGISSPKLLEAFHIARLAEATRVLGNAEPLFDLVNGRALVGGGGSGTEKR
jgi:alkylhydroperoxidase/carboxymuconolactone decarboxylase family protein YurZ